MGEFHTGYDFTTDTGRRTANVTVRAPHGLQAIDEYMLWGLLGTTLCRKDAEPVLLATPYWLLNHLGLATGGSQYVQFRESLLRLAITSYESTGFYNPLNKEREYVALQFLSLLLPTVGGEGDSVDTNRCWRIEWNPAFFRFCRATGSTLLFDLELYRQLTPSSRRLFLKLKDRFWRAERVFLSVDDLTVNGLGFSAARPLRKRKHDLLACLRELLDHDVLALGPGQTDPTELFMKRGKGSYVVALHEGEYFRRREAKPSKSEKNAILDDPLNDPLSQIGIDQAGIRRLLTEHGRGLIQRWVSITDAAMHEKPRGFPGFKVSPAAFLINGVQNNRTPPDWWHAHEKRREKEQWERHHAGAMESDESLRPLYDQQRTAALHAFLTTPEGQRGYDEAMRVYRAFYQNTDPHDCERAAHKASLERVAKYHFSFPTFEVWSLQQRLTSASAPAEPTVHE